MCLNTLIKNRCTPTLSVNKFALLGRRGNTSQASKAIKFWEFISVQEAANGRQLLMDGKPMRTPAGNNLLIPYEKPAVLAELIAQEWRSLHSLKLKSHLIPLTSLAGRSIDITKEQIEEEIPKLLKYLDTDTFLVLSPKKDCEGKVRAAQDKLFPPVIEEARKEWGLPKTGLSTLDTEIAICGNYQPIDTRNKVSEWMRSLDHWQFASLERATATAKSLILGMNTVLQKMPVKEISDLSNLDVNLQTEFWGMVEDTHDVLREDVPRLLGSAYINSLKEEN